MLYSPTNGRISFLFVMLHTSIYILSELPRYFHPNFWRVLNAAENNENRESNKERLSRALIMFLDLYNEQTDRIHRRPLPTTTTPPNQPNSRTKKKGKLVSNVVANLKRFILPNSYSHRPKHQQPEVDSEFDQERFNIVLLGIPQTGKRYVSDEPLYVLYIYIYSKIYFYYIFIYFCYIYYIIYLYPSLSTIYKQLCEVYFPMSSTTRDSYSDIIHNNVFNAMKYVIQQAHDSNIPFKVSPVLHNNGYSKASYTEVEHWFLEGDG